VGLNIRTNEELVLDRKVKNNVAQRILLKGDAESALRKMAARLWQWAACG
jgi:hypothetical protein